MRSEWDPNRFFLQISPLHATKVTPVETGLEVVTFSPDVVVTTAASFSYPLASLTFVVSVPETFFLAAAVLVPSVVVVAAGCAPMVALTAVVP